MITILILDTDRTSIDTYETWLKKYNVLIASTAQDALSLLSRYPQTQIIITQQFLEDMELDEFISRAIKMLAAMYVIVTSTAKPSRTTQSQLTAYGADAILYKPFSFEQLRLLLDNFLNKRPAHPRANHL